VIPDVRDRYLRDPVFHTVVKHIRAILRGAVLTPSEVREAAMVACVIEEQYNPRPPFSTSDEELERIRVILAGPQMAPPTPPGEEIVTCERCQLKVPERLARPWPGVRGGMAARCAACNPQPGPDGEANRQEVIALRRARLNGPAR